MRCITLLRVLLYCGLAIPASAQSTFADMQSEGLPTVYVTDRAGQETTGKLLSLTDSAIVLQLKGATRTFNPGEVRLIERKGDSLKNGTIIGLVVGSAIGAMAGGMGDCPASAGNCAAARIGGTLIGVGIWTAVGAGIDAAIPGRTRIWPGKSAGKTSSVTLAISPQTRGAFIGWRLKS